MKSFESIPFFNEIESLSRVPNFKMNQKRDTRAFPNGESNTPKMCEWFEFIEYNDIE